MKTTKVLYIWLTCITIALSHPAWAQIQITISEPMGAEFTESALITNVSAILLDIEEYGSITEDMEMKADNENIFILDNRNTQCVFRYNYRGEFLNKICTGQNISRTNNFPMLSNPARFSIDPYRNHIEIYRFESSTNFLFDYDGNEVGSFKFSVTPPDFIRSSNDNYWISTGWNNAETQYRLLKTDNKGNVIDRKLRLITRCTPTESFAFHANNNDISFWELLGNTVYTINDDEITPRYVFDFGNYNLPLEYHSIDGGDSFMMINQRGYYTIKRYIENDDFAYMALNFISTEQRAMFHIIYDKKAGKENIYTENAAIGLFDKAHFLTNDNELLFLVSPRKVRNLFRGNRNMPQTFENLQSEIGNTRTPVVLKIKLTPETQTIESNQGYFEDFDAEY